MKVRELSRAEQVEYVAATVGKLSVAVPRSRAAEFAATIPCDAATVTRWLDGDNLPSYYMAQRIVERLKSWK